MFTTSHPRHINTPITFPDLYMFYMLLPCCNNLHLYPWGGKILLASLHLTVWVKPNREMKGSVQLCSQPHILSHHMVGFIDIAS
jgi:hypothetical protein